MNLSLNLLPPEKKDELRNLRQIGTIMKVFFVGLFAWALFLVFVEFCLFVIALQQKNLDKGISLFRQNASYLKAKSAQDMLSDYSQKSGAVERELKERDNHWGVISQINQIMPAGIILKELSVDEANLRIKGTAVRREDLLELEEKLKKSQNFENVESPISNIVSGTNAEFEITATIKNEKEG